MATMTKANAPAFTPISLRAASMLVPCSPNRITRLAITGQIRTIALPGERMKFAREDVVKLVESGELPAD